MHNRNLVIGWMNTFQRLFYVTENQLLSDLENEFFRMKFYRSQQKLFRCWKKFLMNLLKNWNVQFAPIKLEAVHLMSVFWSKQFQISFSKGKIKNFPRQSWVSSVVRLAQIKRYTVRLSLDRPWDDAIFLILEKWKLWGINNGFNSNAFYCRNLFDTWI